MTTPAIQGHTGCDACYPTVPVPPRGRRARRRGSGAGRHGPVGRHRERLGECCVGECLGGRSVECAGGVGAGAYAGAAAGPAVGSLAQDDSGPELDPQTRADAENARSKFVVALIAAGLLGIIIWGRVIRRKRARKDGG
ncbi:hypothetical protein BJF85_19720 [Saccharomonospora sp. CUA-673]|uniref:hypothetical protein n=1 Tax=Saccharomonospora sp. CUA-673 TaxID=1904969 RepID=UPI000966B830|nr:hypothetical protein [Saccharomonospora sp. CUA-673]OLT44704.1 hypothetical protein BJF85_19720 [Saccharomonospora sp. CUA-673]